MGIWHRRANVSQIDPIAPGLSESDREYKAEAHEARVADGHVTVEASRNQTNSMWWLPAIGIASGVACFLLLIGLIIFYRKYWKNSENESARKNLWLPQNVPHVGTVKCFDPNKSDTTSSCGSDLGVTACESPANLGDCLTSTKVQPERKPPQLHRYRNSSTSSLARDSSKGSESDDSEGSSSNNGKIWFSAKYSFEEKLLYVEILKAKHLKGRSMFYSPRDPFVRLYLLPDESNYYQTKVRYRTLSPKFKETFTFKLDYEKSSNRSLKFVIYDFDKRNVRHSLGQTVVPLANADLQNGAAICSELDNFPQKIVYVGEMQIALNCNPYTDKMKVAIIRLKNLPVKCNGKTYSIYIRIDLYHGRRMMKSKMTSMYPVANVIEVNESFAYGISGKHLDSCSLTISVVLRDKEANSSAEDKTIGRLIVGPFLFARGRELLHWQEMLCNPRTTVEKWHHLCEVV